MVSAPLLASAIFFLAPGAWSVTKAIR